jgi:hypothetical protein
MYGDHFRYFIELQPPAGTPPVRSEESNQRKRQATDFISLVHEWLNDNLMMDQVSSLAVTALGQVQITCRAEIIDQIRHQDVLGIAEIRSGTHFSELARVGR